MGNRMMCVTTPKKQVTQGDANTPVNHCVTTPPPKGGGGVVERLVVLLRWWSKSTASELSRALRKSI